MSALPHHPQPRRLFLPVLALLLLCASAQASLPDEKLADPALENRARAIGHQLRCVVCQAESIEDSPADLARDMRLLVREKLVEGQTDAEIIGYLQQRYGDYVLMRPPLKAATSLLWLGPPLLLIVAGLALWLFFRGRKNKGA